MTRIERAAIEQVECGERARHRDYDDSRGARQGSEDWIAEEADAWVEEFRVRDPERARALLDQVREYDARRCMSAVEDGPAE